ncbi:glycosyltransferase family 4 protein [Agromyces intestinalis]|uniref:D-inositol 3-phosphate glycosyltransferase n=1 Tax=Agromyces intestinalis TaxID=2592652 RepID=A0A5C1YEW2_9MICO|nr:glycosyltransferase family 4 protein [Agromyces intestinalis]QEO13557.1 glycosyltransferase family 4 protein [Agromyces intestinalis]
MRVTLVSRIFSPEPAAASFRLRALTAALAVSGDEVRVLTTTPPPGAPADEPVPGVEVRRAPVLRDRTGYVRGYASYLSFDVPAFFRVLFGRRADAIVVEPPPTTGFVVRIAAAIRRVPYVYYAADVWSDAAASTGAPSFVVRTVRAMERFALRGAGAVIAVTEGVGERVGELAPKARVEVVRNGIDTEVFRPVEASVPRAAVAVYAGTTSEWQGADLFIRAMPAVRARVPEAVLVFLGQGSAWRELEQLAATIAPGAVEFHPPVAAAEASRRLADARAGLVSLKPGIGYDFAVPTKILATAATGTPVVLAGPRGPAAEMVRRGALGDAVDYDVHAVAERLAARLADDAPAAERDDRVRWVRENASAAVSAGRAAAVVRTVGSRR